MVDSFWLFVYVHDVKITIQRLGKIRNAELRLRPITLLVGENNTNKSWTAYAAYALLRALAQIPSGPQPRPRLVTRSVAQRINLIAREAAKRISLVPSSAAINLEFKRREILNALEGDLGLSLGPRQLSDVLAVPQNLIKGAKVSLYVPKKELGGGPEFFVFSLGPDGGLIYGPTVRHLKKGLPLDMDHFTNFFEELGAKNLTFSFESTKRTGWEKQISTMLLDFTLQVFGNVFALPAERKALVSMYKPLSEDPKIEVPLPLRHFITNLRNAESQTRNNNRRLSVPKSNRHFQVYSKLLNVLGGQLNFEGSDQIKHLTYSPTKRLSLPIQAASSMVRSLTGFAIAIKEFVQGENVLVIDEPEMNAHPRAQLAIVEMMAVLANLGNYVIATTHSPYVVDHFNNLIAASELSGKVRERASKKFVLKMPSAFLSSEKVAAYELSRTGDVTDLMSVDRRRIATTTFGNVSDKLGNIYGDLLEMKEQ